MSERPVEGACFTVVDSRRGTTQSVRVGESTGKWGAFTVYALDFTPSAPGTYWISVAGRVFATSPEFHVYLRSAADWAAAYIHADPSSGILSLGDVSALAHYDLFRALASESDAKDYAVTPADLLGNLKKTLDAAVAQSASDPFGYGVPWGIGDTPTQGASLVVLASAYDHLANTSRYAPYVDRWLANILGANAWGVSLIVGDGSSFPRCIHHQVANLIGSRDGRPPILAGAVVEGPIRHPKLDPVPTAIRCPHSGGDPFALFNRRST